MRRLTALLALPLAACYGPLQPGAVEPVSIDPALDSLPIADVFDAASVEYGVPADLLAAIAWHASSLAPEPEDADFAAEDGHGHASSVGWMGLSDAALAVAVDATGLDPAALADDREANVYGAAAVLAVSGRRFGAGPALDARWFLPVADYADLGEDWLDHSFAWDVFRTLQAGLAVETKDGDLVVLDPRELPGLADVPYVAPPGADGSAFAAGTDYPGAARFTAASSSNYSSRSNGTASIRRVVLHTTEGSYAGAISWFRNSSASVSAHYVVRKSDGEITQMVRDSKKAWHACSNNNDTIGIEHEGASSSASTWTPAMVESSARLTAWLVNAYNIPIDRDHIVGHGEIQPASCAYRYDPGSHFPWDEYMTKVQAYAIGSSPAAELPDPVPPPTLPGPETPAPAPRVDIESPRTGDVVVNPVVVRIASQDVHHTELWSGAYRVAQDLAASPVHVGVMFSGPGSYSLTAKGLSAEGAVIAEKTVTVQVVQPGGHITPLVTPVSGMTYRLSASSDTASVVSARFWMDGTVLGGGGSAAAPNFEMQHTFSAAGTGRLLQVRGYDAGGNVIAEGFAYVDIGPVATSGGITNVDTQEAGGTVMLFRTAADPAVRYVEYWIDGWRLPDMVTGRTYGEPNEFSLWYRFNYTGDRQLLVKAFDSAWNLLDTEERVVHVPSAALTVGWTRSSSMQYRFDAEAPAGTQRVVISIDGWALRDQSSNLQYTTGPAYVLNYHFNYAGSRALTARALDSAGNTVGTYSATIQVY
jgi:hypothetical protein